MFIRNSRKKKIISRCKMKSFTKSKKAIIPVVAISLLLVVSVMAVIAFSDWYKSFSSSTLVVIEKQNSDSSSVSVLSFVGSNLYIKSNGNTSINSISINSVNCNFNGSISGLDSINVSSCIGNVSGFVSIVIITENNIIESSKYIEGVAIDSPSASVSEALSIVGYNSTFGQWIGGSDADRVHSISVDSLDNVYVGGIAQTDISDDGLGTISGVHSGNDEGFVFKFNSSGSYEWGQWIGGNNQNKVNSISVDSLDNVYVGGYASSDITDDGLGTISGNYSGNVEGFVFKFNSSGGSVWGQWLGGSTADYVNSISVDSLDNVYVGGSADSDITDDGIGTISGTYSGTEGFVFKFNSSGDYEWGQWLGGASNDYVNSISVDSLDNVYVGGSAATDITDDGLGTVSGTYSGNYEAFVFKFNSSGGSVWGQWLGGASSEFVNSISVDSLDNVYVGGISASDITDDGLGTISGTYSGLDEGFVFKFNSSGGYEFGQWIGGSSYDYVKSISVDSLDNVYVGGRAQTDNTDDGLGDISGTYSGNAEGFVFKFNSSGVYEWGQWFGGSSYDYVNSISVDSLDNLYVGGYAYTDITDDGIGNISGVRTGNHEGFIFKFEYLYE
jgi:hypothetical protein